MIGSELWSDQPGFDEAVSDTGITGICGSGIIEALAEYLAGIINEDGVIDGALAATTDRIRPDGRTFSYQQPTVPLCRMISALSSWPRQRYMQASNC